MWTVAGRLNQSKLIYVNAVIVKALWVQRFQESKFVLRRHKGAIVFNLRPTGIFDKLPGKFTFFEALAKIVLSILERYFYLLMALTPVCSLTFTARLWVQTSWIENRFRRFFSNHSLYEEARRIWRHVIHRVCEQLSQFQRPIPFDPTHACPGEHRLWWNFLRFCPVFESILIERSFAKYRGGNFYKMSVCSRGCFAWIHRWFNKLLFCNLEDAIAIYCLARLGFLVWEQIAGVLFRTKRNCLGQAFLSKNILFLLLHTTCKCKNALQQNTAFTAKAAKQRWSPQTTRGTQKGSSMRVWWNFLKYEHAVCSMFRSL